MQVFFMDFATVWLVFCSSIIHLTNHNKIKYNLKITSVRVKIENKNLNAILDSTNFKIEKFEKRGRAMAQVNGTSHGLRSFPKLR